MMIYMHVRTISQGQYKYAKKKKPARPLFRRDLFDRAVVGFR
jgi:hypothetical protein